MTRSQNGWPLATSEQMAHTEVAGVGFSGGTLKGDVTIVMDAVSLAYHHRVERLHPGWCWGFDRRKIKGTEIWSNHGSGTARDNNAPRHQQGQPASHSMTDHQIAECRAIVHEFHGVVRWGGDFHTSPDVMHWEIVGTEADVRREAKRLTGSNRTEQIVKELPTLKAGAKGNDVRRVQALGAIVLNVHHLVDGDFGPDTTELVRKVQGHAKLTADGIVGPLTWAVLLGVD